MSRRFRQYAGLFDVLVDDDLGIVDEQIEETVAAALVAKYGQGSVPRLTIRRTEYVEERGEET